MKHILPLLLAATLSFVPAAAQPGAPSQPANVVLTRRASTSQAYGGPTRAEGRSYNFTPLFLIYPDARVDEAAAGGAGWTQRAVYELLRDGFDVVGLKRPPWWKFGTAGRTLTVCARRKNWRNRGTPIVGSALPVSSAMLSPRERSR